MKNVLLTAMLALTATFSLAQSGNLYIANHTDFDVEVTMYAEAATSCGAGCNTTFITNPITVLTPTSPAFPAGTTVWGPNNPCGVSTTVGWASAACATTWCPGTGIPADFQWTLAKVNLDFTGVCWPGAFPAFVAPRQPVCIPGIGPIAGPFSGCSMSPNIAVQWITTGGTYADVLILINQY